MTIPLILSQDVQALPAVDQILLGRRRCDGSFLQRFTSLRGSNTDVFSGSRASYERLLGRVQPADVIERGDTHGQVLILLELDTGRRDQLRTIAESHGWPAPQPRPWDHYIATHHSDSD